MSEQVKQAVERLGEAIRTKPSSANATFRAVTTSAEDSVHTTSRIRGFEVAHDEPVELGGTNAAPNPVEAVLAALGSCQAIVYRAYASVLGLRLDEVRVDAIGDLDLRGLVGAAPVTAGLQRIAFRTRIVSPEPEEKLRELARIVEARCPVLETLRLPVDVSGILELARPANREAA